MLKKLKSRPMEWFQKRGLVGAVIDEPESKDLS